MAASLDVSPPATKGAKGAKGALIAPIFDDGPEARRQRRRLRLQPGVHVLRYLCRAPAPAPLAVVAPVPARFGRVELLAPGCDGTALLSHYGDMAVIHAEGEAAVDLTVILPEGFPETAVDIHLERLSPEPPSRAGSGERARRGILLAGHIEGMGDRTAQPGEWLGDPEGSARLEGFAIHWPDRPKGVDISYGAVLEGGRPTPTVLSGRFIGTRGRLLAIEAVALRILGRGAPHVAVEARFRRSGAVGLADGMLAGRGAGDHLTALRICLSDATINRTETAEPIGSEPSPPGA